MKRNYFILVILVTSFFNACAQNHNNKTNSNMQYEVNKTEEEWKKQLGEEEYYVLREKGTERPHTGKFLMHKEKGIYKCGACGNELFTDDMKFDSHCGWPSFDKEISGGKIKQIKDNSHGMQRVEILCAKCGGHLGHIFDDGPTETGMRYCVNSLSLSFEPAKTTVANTNSPTDTITLGGGCFWCIEAVFEQLKGVQKVSSGFSGGSKGDASYKLVCSGTTKHVEVVQVEYNKNEISLAEILKVFFTVHDPTTLNRQGADVGTQYRSVVFFRNEEQKNIAENIIQKLNTEKVYSSNIVTAVESFDAFYVAENYHQDYYNLNKEQPYCRMVIQPKLEKFEKAFKEIIKK